MGGFASVYLTIKWQLRGSVRVQSLLFVGHLCEVLSGEELETVVVLRRLPQVTLVNICIPLYWAAWGIREM